jgi:hypothetical protein
MPIALWKRCFVDIRETYRLSRLIKLEPFGLLTETSAAQYEIFSMVVQYFDYADFLVVLRGANGFFK